MFNFFNPFMSSCVAQFNLLNYFPVINSFRPCSFYDNLYQNNYYSNVYQNNNRINSVFTQNAPKSYNSTKGEILYRNSINYLPSKPLNPPMCARYVKNTVVRSGLGNYVLGNGEQSKYMFRTNLNFREIKVPGNELKNLPKGTVVVYDANDIIKDPQGNIGQIGEDGHVLFTHGDGTGSSDRLEPYIPISDNAHVFIPV